MKKRFYLLLSACFLFCQSYAGHIPGMEIRYTGAGNGVYDVFVHVYRECSGNTPVPQPLTARCSSLTVTIPVTAQTKVLVRSVNSCGTGCAGGGTIEEHVWKMTLDLSSYQCCQWLLSYEMIHSRHNGQVFFTTAELNRCITTPVSFTFDEAPAFLITHNQDVSLNLGIGTTSGVDSVSYELTEAWQSLGQSIAYTGNFSYFRPLTFFGFPNQNLQWPAGFHLNQDGNILFRPTQVNQVATIAVKALFWTEVNNVMTVVGYTVRDFEVTVVQGSNTAPSLTGFQTYPVVNEIYLCAGDSDAIWINATDANGDSIFVEDMATDTGVNIVLDSLRPGQGKIGIQAFPLLSDTNGVYSKELSFKLMDRGCPYSGSKRYVFRLRSARKPQMTQSLSVVCDSTHVTLNVIDSVNNKFYARMKFLDDKNVQLFSAPLLDYSMNLPPGKYHLVTEHGYPIGCVNTFDSSFEVLPNFKYSLTGPTIICEEDTARVLLVDAGSTGSFNLQWSSPQSQNWQDSGYVLKAWPDVNSQFSVNITDNNGCSVTYSHQLSVTKKPVYTLADSLRYCPHITPPIGPYPLNYTDSIKWFDGINTVIRPATQTGWYSFKAYTGQCMYSDSIHILFREKPTILYPTKDTVVCQDDTVHLGVSGGAGFYGFKWNNVTGPDYVQPHTTSFYVITVTDYLGCMDSKTILVTVPLTPILFFDPPMGSEVCANDSLLVTVNGVPSSSLLHWNGGPATGHITYLKSGAYDLKLIDPYGCAYDYNYYVVNAPMPDPDFTFFSNQGKIVFQPVTTVGTHLWFFGDEDSSVLTQPDHDYAVPGMYTATHHVTNSFSCADSSSALISTVGLPGQPVSRLLVYPNPFTESMQLVFAEAIDGLVLVDVQGREYAAEWKQAGEHVSIKVPQELAPGVYFLRITTAQKQWNVEVQKR